MLRSAPPTAAIVTDGDLAGNVTSLGPHLRGEPLPLQLTPIPACGSFDDSTIRARHGAAVRPLTRQELRHKTDG